MANAFAVSIASDQSSVPVAGGVAHDATDSGNPLKTGLQARTTWPSAVADSDRVNAIGDKYGRTVVVNTPARFTKQTVNGDHQRGIDPFCDCRPTGLDRLLSGCKQVVLGCLVVRQLVCACAWRTTARPNL